MKQKGNALISVLAAAAVIMLLVVVAMYGGFGPRKTNRPDGLGKTVQGAARARALDMSCVDHLSQIRQSIQLYMGADETPPASLEELKLPSEMLRCPIGKEAYEYDAATGAVKCPHPGHEKL